MEICLPSGCLITLQLCSKRTDKGTVGFAYVIKFRSLTRMLLFCIKNVFVLFVLFLVPSGLYELSKHDRWTALMFCFWCYLCFHLFFDHGLMTHGTRHLNMLTDIHVSRRRFWWQTYRWMEIRESSLLSCFILVRNIDGVRTHLSSVGASGVGIDICVILPPISLLSYFILVRTVNIKKKRKNKEE